MSESSSAADATDASSNVALRSFSSTPLSTISPDRMSLASEPDVDSGKPSSMPLATRSRSLNAPSLAAALRKQANELPKGDEMIDVGISQLPALLGFEYSAPEADSSTSIEDGDASLRCVKALETAIERDMSIDAPSESRDTPGRARRACRTDPAGYKNVAQVFPNSLPGSGPPRHSSAADGDMNMSMVRAKSARTSKNIPSTSTPKRHGTRLSGIATKTMATSLSSVTKQGRTTMKGVACMSRELMRLRDTNEFAKIEDRPVQYTVWANGKFVDPQEEARKKAEEQARAKAEAEAAARAEKHAAQAAAEAEDVEEEAQGQKVKNHSTQTAEALSIKKPRVKKWLETGLYAGQAPPDNPEKIMTSSEKASYMKHPKLHSSGKENKALPLPMFHGLRMLVEGRDFKLPFDVCNPLPPGQPKPANWRVMTRNRFIGDAKDIWKKTPLVEDSKCVCKPEDGCGDDCQNRIMLYECDDSNCNIGKELCTNRAFQDLAERVKRKNPFRIGVEVYKTDGRGYGVRSNRCFQPNQIITEYTGEIITNDECDRRMNEDYKDNECYYLMSFDQNMIIDATTGSIARFVNHSCSPNCRMVKWIVSGQPKMALFAGDRPIMTGEELTYDYNFDPFSAKNVQKCLCGSANCRGVLGPKSKEVKAPKAAKEDRKGKAGPTLKKGAVSLSSQKAELAGSPSRKRKLNEMLGTGDDEGGKPGAPKKTKLVVASKSAAKSVSKKTAYSFPKTKLPTTGSSKLAVAKAGSAIVAKVSERFTISPTKKMQFAFKSVKKLKTPVKRHGQDKVKAAVKAKQVVSKGNKATGPTKVATSNLHVHSEFKAKVTDKGKAVSPDSVYDFPDHSDVEADFPLTRPANPKRMSILFPNLRRKNPTEPPNVVATASSSSLTTPVKNGAAETASEPSSKRKRTPSRKVLESEATQAALADLETAARGVHNTGAQNNGVPNAPAGRMSSLAAGIVSGV